MAGPLWLRAVWSFCLFRFSLALNDNKGHPFVAPADTLARPTKFLLSHSYTSGKKWARKPNVTILLKMRLWHLCKEAVRISLSYNDTYYCKPTFELF